MFNKAPSDRVLLLLLASFLGLFPTCRIYGAEPTTVRPPNILWIVGENLDLDLGCYGVKNVHTRVLKNKIERVTVYFPIRRKYRFSN